MTGPRVAVVGCGRWGRLIVDDLEDLGADVVTVDSHPDAGADLPDASALGVHAPIEGAVVATPASQHLRTLEALAPLGVPVFCEKPLAPSVDDAEAAAALLGSRLHLMHVWRYHPGVELLGAVARSGRIGEVHGMRTVRDGWTSPRTDVDAVWTLVPHDLTLAIEVLGQIPTARSALAEVLDGRAVGIWAHLGGAGQPFLAVEASTRFGDKRREIRVHGSEGVAVLRHDGDAEVTLELGQAASPRIEQVAFAPEPPLRRELAAFLGHLAGGPPPKSSAAEGVDVVRAVDRLRTLAGLPR
ncbi:MAG: Gfo/Idh/MocA family protein [Aquihabitans sp.]